jgi:hypothetical protein
VLETVVNPSEPIGDGWDILHKAGYIQQNPPFDTECHWRLSESGGTNGRRLATSSKSHHTMLNVAAGHQSLLEGAGICGETHQNPSKLDNMLQKLMDVGGTTWKWLKTSNQSGHMSSNTDGVTGTCEHQRVLR